VLRFHYTFSDNERKMAEDMVATGREMLEAAGIEVVGTDEKVLTEGWSIHELGTARMGSDPKTSVLNQFQQSHDVPNLLVVDGSSHVSASCQNPRGRSWRWPGARVTIWRTNSGREPMTDAPKHAESVSRREMIAATAAALVTPLLPGVAAPRRPRRRPGQVPDGGGVGHAG